ncbi:hypothetical protein OAI84_00385 [bacterium]|nr:hypothetical protein [bacterium]
MLNKFSNGDLTDIMEKDLTKYDVIVRKKIGTSLMAADIKCVKINGERLILKTFKKKYGKRFLRAMEIYFKCKDEDFLPKLRYYDTKHKILALSDVGEALEKWIPKHRKTFNKLRKKFNKELKNMIDVFYDKYGYYHNDTQNKNICIDKNNKIRMIDFEFSSNKMRKHNNGRNKKYFIL